MTLALIAISAVCGAVTDLSFNLGGYMWQILNCALTAGYSLSLRGAMDKVGQDLGSRLGSRLCAGLALAHHGGLVFVRRHGEVSRVGLRMGLYRCLHPQCAAHLCCGLCAR